MPNRGSTRGRGRGNFSRKVHKVMAKTIHNSENGYVMKVPSDPPMYTPSPWNSCTVVLGGQNDGDIKVSVIVTQLIKQTGIKAAIADVNIRIQSCRVWQLGRDRPLMVGFFSIIGEGDIVQVMDWPSAISFPKVGYTWSKSRQNTVYNINGQDDKVVSIEVTKDAAWLAYICILWRVQGEKIALYGGSLDTLLKGLSTDACSSQLTPSDDELSILEDLQIS